MWSKISLLYNFKACKQVHSSNIVIIEGHQVSGKKWVGKERQLLLYLTWIVKMTMNGHFMITTEMWFHPPSAIFEVISAYDPTLLHWPGLLNHFKQTCTGTILKFCLRHNPAPPFPPPPPHPNHPLWISKEFKLPPVWTSNCAFSLCTP